MQHLSAPSARCVQQYVEINKRKLQSAVLQIFKRNAEFQLRNHLIHFDCVALNLGICDHLQKMTHFKHTKILVHVN